MSEKDLWLFRIQDMLYSINRIETALKGVSFETYAGDENLQDVVERRFQIIGEAARKVPEHVKERYPGVPWSKMSGLRNFVVHEYNQVDRKIVWDTILKHFPDLKKSLEDVYAKEKNGP